jgi:hypothetical protein
MGAELMAFPDVKKGIDHAIVTDFLLSVNPENSS